MNRKLYAACALAVLCGAPGVAEAQTSAQPFAFRAGQSVYIVAFRETRQPVVVGDETVGTVTRPDRLDFDLDAERKVRKEIERWNYFRVSDRPSAADFIFLVNLDDSSIEGLALSYDAYRRHFKEKFDLDALRDAAYGRYMAGPLNIANISRLTDRLVIKFREKVSSVVIR